MKISFISEFLLFHQKSMLFFVCTQHCVGEQMDTFSGQCGYFVLYYSN